MTLNEIREELSQIKYYYSRKKEFDNASEEIGAYCITSKLSKYNNAIRYANPRLYELYVNLYVENHTIDSFANKLGYTYDYIQKLNTKLVKYFQQTFDLEVN